MKKIKIISPACVATLSLVSSTIGLTTSCSFNYRVEKQKEEINQVSNILSGDFPINDPVKTENYFTKKNTKIPLTKQAKIKGLIENIVNYYRLFEWNNYYQKSSNNLEKSKVLSINNIDYQPNIVTSFKPNQVFKQVKDLRATQIYNGQDQQFRFFNDFINYMNCPTNIKVNQQYNDFFYLRWCYYAISAANIYNTMVVKLKTNAKTHIYDLNISDWINSIVIALIPTPFGGDQKPLTDLLQKFFAYYGFIKINRTNHKSIGAPELMLVADDLAMRFSHISDDELNRYPVLKNKAKRALNMYNQSKEIYDVFFNSLSGNPSKDSIKWPQTDKDHQLSQQDKDKYFNKASGLLDQLKTSLEKIIKELSVNTTVNFTDYVNLANIKGGK